MKVGMAIFTSGKGGVGKTPFALLLSILLRRKGKDILVLDYNFLNPDLFEIFRRLGGEEPEVITEVGGEKLIHPVVVSELYLPGGGRIVAVARREKFRYLPYPPFTIFQTAVALREYYGRDFFAVVDTNLNIPSFNVVHPEMIEAVNKAIGTFSSIYFFHIWSMSSLRRGRSGEERSEIELVRATVKNFSQRNLPLLGKDGEKIVHIVSPRVFGRPEIKSIKERFSAILKTFRGKAEEVLPVELGEKKFVKQYIEKLSLAYERSNRSITLSDMMRFSEEFDRVLKILLSENPRYLIEADPFDVETLFLSFMVDKFFDKATMTLPINAIIIPYMIKKLVNFVDILLVSEVLEEEHILDRQKPATEIMGVWIDKVLSTGKL